MTDTPKHLILPRLKRIEQLLAEILDLSGPGVLAVVEEELARVRRQIKELER